MNYYKVEYQLFWNEMSIILKILERSIILLKIECNESISSNIRVSV